MDKDLFENDYFIRQKSRVKQSTERIAAVYRHENHLIPGIVSTMNYWLDGENPKVIPDD